MKEYKELDVENSEDPSDGAITIGNISFKLCKNILGFNNSYYYSLTMDVPMIMHDLTTNNVLKDKRDTWIDVPFKNANDLSNLAKLFKKASQQDTVYIKNWRQRKHTLKQRLYGCCFNIDITPFRWKFGVSKELADRFRLWIDFAFIHIYIYI